MSHDADRRKPSSKASKRPMRPTQAAAAALLGLAAFGLVMTTGAAQAATTAAATSAKDKPARSAKATKPVKPTRSAKSARSTAPKLPSANKNIAVAAAAVPTQPSALMSAGCLDGRHGDWLSGELGAASGVLPASFARPAMADAADAADAAPAANPADAINAAETTPAILTTQASDSAAACVPFAAVRTPADRIESLAFLPTSVSVAGGEPVRVMVVSRTGLPGAPTTRWHDLAELPAGEREVWLQAAGVLAGDVAEQVPARWQRDVSVLVRQMKRLTHAPDTAWVRLVFSGQGDAVRIEAVELVDDTSGQALDSAIWLDRADGPGGFVSASGGDHERVLWQSPVDYRRISRGVGPATVVVRKRVLAKPKTPGGKPRVIVRSFRTHGQHQGIDYAAPSGTPVVTVADGAVVHAGRSGGYGNLVVVDHGGGITTYYAHLSAFGAGVQEGARVERGQEIGQVGSTGRSTGPHLHYEIRRDGQYLDPANPAQTLPNWNLSADEHHVVLTRLLALSMSRQGAHVRATRQPALAAAPTTGSTAAAE